MRATAEPLTGKRRALLAALPMLLAIAGAGCVHGHKLMDHRPERIDALLARPASGAEQQLQRGWAYLVSGCDWAAAAADLEQATRTPGPQWTHLRQMAWLGLGFIHLAQAEFPDALEAFGHALDQDLATAEGLVAALQLAELAHQVPGGHTRLVAELGELLAPAAGGTRPRPAPEVARTLRRIRLEGALRAGDEAAADGVLAEMGVPPVWRAAYPFGRHPLLGFEQVHAPERGPLDPGALPKRVRLHPVWPQGQRLQYTTDRDDAVVYVEAFFELQRAADLRLRLRSQSSWAAFVDTVALDRHAAYRAHLPGIVHLAFKAGPGWHRLLLKLPVRQGRAEIGVELTGLDGSPAPVSWWRWPQPPPERFQGEVKMAAAPTPLYVSLAKRAEANPDDAATPLLASLLAWEAGDLAGAQGLLDRAGEIAPAFALPDYLSALVHLEDPDLPPGMDAVRARERFGAALEKCPGLDLAAFRLALLEADQGREQKALATLEQLERKRPGSFLWPHYAGRIQAGLGWEQEARFSQLRALQRMSDNTEVLAHLFELAIKLEAVDEQAQLAEQLVALGRWDREIVDLFLARGQTDRAKQLLNQRLERQPDDLAARLMLVDLLERLGDLAEAGAQLELAERIAPGRPEVEMARIDQLERKGQADRALEMRAGLAKRHPWHLGLRKALAAQAGRSRIRVNGSEPLDALSLIEKNKTSQPFPHADAVILYDGAAAEVAADGSSVERVQTLVQVLSPDGLERWGEVEAIPPGAEIEQLRTIKADGTIQAAEVIPGKDSITLPGLQLGDYVELAWVHGLRGAGPLARSYRGRPFLFGLLETPILHSRYSLSVPAGNQLVIDRLNGAPPPKRRPAADGREIYTFTRRASPPLIAEKHAPPIEEVAPLVQAGFGISWSDLRGVLRVELLEAARPTPALIAYAHQAAGQGTQAARLERVFRAVCTEIRQAGPTSDFSLPASYALARREGNRVVVLYALLRILGFEPHLLLARTVGQAQRDFALPSEDSYAHGLLSVALPAGQIWLDPLARFAPFGTLFPFLASMPAIDVSAGPDGPVFTRLPAGTGHDLNKRIDLDLKLFADGTLAGDGREELSTFQAVRYREALAGMSPAEQRQALEAGLGGYFSGALLERFELQALEDPTRPLGIAYQFRVPAWARRRDDRLFLRGGFYPYQLGQNLIAHTKRTTPLLLADRTVTRTRIALRLPPGARAELPEPVSLTAPMGAFEMSVTQEGQRLLIDKRLVVEAGRVSPEDYPAFRDFCLKVDALEAAGLTVQLPAVPGS